MARTREEILMETMRELAHMTDHQLSCALGRAEQDHAEDVSQCYDAQPSERLCIMRHTACMRLRAKEAI